MIKNFECPSCAAPLQYTGGITQYCTYCQGTVIVPTELRPVRVFTQPTHLPMPPQTVIDLRPYTRNRNGKVSGRTKLIIGTLVIFCILLFLAPFLFGIIGMIINIMASVADSM